MGQQGSGSVWHSILYFATKATESGTPLDTLKLYCTKHRKEKKQHLSWGANRSKL